MLIKWYTIDCPHFLFEFLRVMYCYCIYRMTQIMHRSGDIIPQRILFRNTDTT